VVGKLIAKANNDLQRLTLADRQTDRCGISLYFINLLDQ
jgi:hypothetical protein